MLNKITKNLIDYAIFKNAKEIDIDKENKYTTVRFLVDGNWEHIIDFPKNEIDITKEIKSLAMSQEQKNKERSPFRFKLSNNGNKTVFNVSNFIKKNGERMILSLYQEKITLLKLNELGIQKPYDKLISQTIAHPKGLNLIIGSTGSGITTTLYSLIDHINNPSLNISSIEEEVEYNLPGINQIQIETKIGYTISDCLYYLSRHNPDIIIVNDINHPQNTKAAVNHALKGVPIFTSLNADNITDAIIKLLSRGVNASYLSSALNLIIHQKITNNKREYQAIKITDNMVDVLKNPRISKSQIEQVVSKLTV